MATDATKLGKALYRAAGDGDLAKVNALIGAGAPLDWQLPLAGTTALHKACARDDVECARALIKGGADVRIAANTGSTALHWCVESGAPACLALLLTTDAKYDLKHANFDGETAVSLAVAAGLDDLAATLSLAADDAGDGPPRPAATAEGGADGGAGES
mmetsp:Transcript_7052/g.25084  ORF Transcript_7052/g.25084 Transcript_7052/m.25084 type:complete len:159 (-) Transcript_7052:233-709(-)